MARTGKKKVRRRAKDSSTGKPRTNGSAAPAAVPAPPTRVWRPGVDRMEEGEELQWDPTAYDCLHAFSLGWPCLSFDIVRDTLGALRHEFPHTMFCVAGTQADSASRNALAVVKLSNITGKSRTQQVHEDDDGSESESDSDSEDNDAETESDKTPKLNERMIPHNGGINRVRSMHQQPHIVAFWSDTGVVEVWDVSAHLNSIAAEDISEPSNNLPSQILQGHKDEGFALDWSPFSPGRLATGDCRSSIRVWEPASGSKWIGDKVPYSGHTASVEDLQWSPSEDNVLASCSVDKTIAVWDTRTRRQAVSLKAHDKDVNVISWNRLASCMLASGSDDGILRIWDLRSFKDDSFVAHFKYHTAAITSVEWSPHDASQLAVTSEDNQLTVWDLSLERDAEEEAQFQAELGKEQAEAQTDLPPQLLFIHQGQTDMKELHWHPQIHNLMLSTAGDGFNVFKASNI